MCRGHNYKGAAYWADAAERSDPLPLGRAATELWEPVLVAGLTAR